MNAMICRYKRHGLVWWHDFWRLPGFSCFYGFRRLPGFSCRDDCRITGRYRDVRFKTHEGQRINPVYFDDILRTAKTGTAVAVVNECSGLPLGKPEPQQVII